MAFEVPVTTVLDKHSQLESSVTQRLKWGAGANPTMSAVLKEFEEILVKKESVMTVSYDMIEYLWKTWDIQFSEFMIFVVFAWKYIKGMFCVKIIGSLFIYLMDVPL